MNATLTTPLPSGAPASSTLSSEVEQFCDLLARIYARCLQEQDSEVLSRLAGTTNTKEEVKHAAA